jgi:hypothetical protein
MYDSQDVSMRLMLIAAKAQQLAADVLKGKLWPGDLSRGLGEIGEQMRRLEGACQQDR